MKKKELTEKAKEFALNNKISLKTVYKRLGEGSLRRRADGNIINPAGAAGPHTLSEVRLFHEKLKARKTKIELAVLENDVIAVSEMEDVFFTTFRSLRDRIQDLPARLADPIVAMSRDGTAEVAAAAVRSMLSAELNSILQEVADGPRLRKNPG